MDYLILGLAGLCCVKLGWQLCRARYDSHIRAANRVEKKLQEILTLGMLDEVHEAAGSFDERLKQVKHWRSQ